MGTYHSYPGDAKLEDSKDNWYRISGMNTTGADMFGFKYSEKAAGGQYGIRNSTTQVTLFKLVQSFTNIYGIDPVTENIDSRGNAFIIKDKQLEFQNIFPDDSRDKKLYGKAYYISNHTPLYIGIYGIRTLASPRGIRLETVQPDENVYFRPMLTLKPVGAQIDMIFKLVLRVTRTLRDPQYTLGTAIEIIDGPRNLIRETKFDVYLDKDGEIKQPPAPAADYNTLKATMVTPSAGELYASSAPWGAQLAYGAINVRFALINGKYLYLKNPEILAGLENIPWDANGGVNSGTITLTNLDTYSI